MSCSRRHFMAGMSAGALIMMTGPTRSPCYPLAHSQTIDGVRFGMLHDRDGLHRLYRLHGCLPGGESGARRGLAPRIIRSGPSAPSPMPSTTSFASPASTATTPLRARLPDRCLPYPQGGMASSTSTGSLRRCMYCLAACPYQVRFINPCDQGGRGAAGCRKTNLAAGKEPACVGILPRKALVFGNLDDPDSPIAKRLVKETTYRYKQALGTSPKMYRVPKGEIKS